MKKIILAMLIVLSGSTFAQEPTEPQQIQVTPNQQQQIKQFFESKNECQLDDKAERRGCCSHHEGVCGCSGGRAQCCDGSLSPSCGC